MTTITVSLGQMDVRDGDPRRNWGTVQELITEAAHRATELLVLPELWDSGFALDRAKEYSSTLSGGLFAQVAALSRSSQMVIIGSMLEKRGVGVYNSAAVFSPINGIAGAYRKIHLFEGMAEAQYLSAGESPLSVDLPWGTTGIGICYDLRFPELFRRYFLDGAKVIVIPAQWPSTRINHWRALLQARAIENQCFVIGCNRVGEYQRNVFDGHSMVVNPWGEVVAEVGSYETMLTVKINLNEVDDARNKIPALNDRRPSVYGIF